MAAALSTGMNKHPTIPPLSDTNKIPVSFTSPVRLPTRRFTIFCNSTKNSPDLAQVDKPHQQSCSSLADQLKPIFTTILSDTPTKQKDKVTQTHLPSKPKSTWVNPTKPRRSVLSLHRHKRSPHSYGPQFRDLKLFAQQLNECGSSKAAFMAVLEQIPHPPTRENALLILNSLKPWQKTHLFFKWVKTQNLFPMETVFYNVTMKSLRYGRQFQLIEELANEMISNDIDLDNITYSTIITCANRCNLFDKAVEWFEGMYKTGLMPDEVTYSAILDVYGKLGKVEEAMTLYERGRASGWKPDPIAFSVLGKMFGEAGDDDGIRFVLQEMKSLEVQPNLVVYNTLLEAMGKAGNPGLARTLFEEMIDSGITPNERTLTALVKIYGKARWARDALELWELMRLKRWPMDLILYNTLLSMCADIGLEEEAEKLFQDMKHSEHCRPNSWSYTGMLNVYGSGGKVDRAMELFEEMSEKGLQLNIMGCTCLIQCLGRAKRIDDLVKVFGLSIERGIEPDDKLCGCLLSVVALCDDVEKADKVLTCLQQANPKLVAFIKLLEEEAGSIEIIKEEFKGILNEAAVEVRRPFCNCLIDICRNRNLNQRAHDLLYLGILYGLYPRLHYKTAEEWRLNVRSLSVGAAYTALEEWMESLTKIVERQEALPALFSAHTGAGTHKFSQGMANAFASHVKKLAAPFRQSEENVGCFVATRADIVSWLQSSHASATVKA
ncbi:pentatricopeptide repeat-containing protein At5g46580, chloroplastic [Malania oleifera]|uniref:pentatricopeptide repeat-containing protein At5g46580, chloroplastic n=1 Tax=Malania oleifera TaxID=397392 RepID=UPI0025AE633E|nr:pentatricopeptide repeat-containing protein At5g46580, chloroplastic [Malania oleifera]